MQTKNERILNAKIAIGGAKYSIAQCDELLTALRAHNNKLVDKRFFEKHFTVSNEYNDYTKFSLSPKRYEWDKHNHVIWLQRYHESVPTASGHEVTHYSDFETIELDSRETAHLIERIEAKKQQMLDRIEYQTELLAQLEAVDNSAIIADLIAVYEKHGAPVTWNECLEDYKVKYPN